MSRSNYNFKRYSTAIYDYESEVDKGLQIKERQKIYTLCTGTAKINITAQCYL